MRLGRRCLTIRFEDLSRDPVAVLTRIEDWSDISLARTRQTHTAAEVFRVGHIVTGNRLRKHGAVKFNPLARGRTERRRSACMDPRALPCVVGVLRLSERGAVDAR